MRVDFANLDYAVLERLYSSKSQELEKALLTGRSWHEVRIQRKHLSEISIAMHNKLQGINQPARRIGRS